MRDPDGSAAFHPRWFPVVGKRPRFTGDVPMTGFRNHGTDERRRTRSNTRSPRRLSKRFSSLHLRIVRSAEDPYAGGVKAVPGTLQEGGAPFRSTHWTVVLLAARSQSEEAARAALANLCQTYWPPLYTFLRRRGRSPSEAQDLTQSFVAHLIESNTFAHAVPGKGQLRTFLLGSLQNFLANEHDRATALKRGGGQPVVSLDDHLVEAEAALGTVVRGEESKGYDRHWAANLVGRAWTELYRALVAEGKRDWAEAFKPFLLGGAVPLPPQEDLAARLGMPIATFRNALWRLRQRYRENIRAEVARTVGDPSQIDEEMRYLLQVLLS